MLAPLLAGSRPALEGPPAGQARTVPAAAVPRARTPLVARRASTSRERRSCTDSRRPSAAAALAAAVLLVPVASAAPGLGVGHSMLALGGMLALARFSVSTAAWDTENGFALMGASRDLTISVFTEAALVLSLAVAALVAGTTDLTGIVAGTAGGDAWTSPGLALGAVGFALVVLAETGRQPFDNPDTHLELTMIHEGPVSSTAAAISRSCSGVLLLGTGSSSCSRRRSSFRTPRACGSNSQLLPVVLVVLCGALALVETLVAKMRILLAPRLLAVGAAAALLGVLSWLIETT